MDPYIQLINKITLYLYIQWIEKYEIDRVMDTPMSVEKILYAKNWDLKYKSIVEMILLYLVRYGFITDNNSTYILPPNYTSLKEQLYDEINDSKELNNEIAQFTIYSLEILTSLLQGNSIKWSENKYYLYERILNLDIHKELSKCILNTIKESNKHKLILGGDVLSVGIYSLTFDSLLDMINELDNIGYNVNLIVPDESSMKKAISLLELEDKTTRFINKLVKYENISTKYDIFVIFSGLGFNYSCDKFIPNLNELIVSNGYLIISKLNCLDQIYLGIEPLLQLIPEFVDFKSMKLSLKLLQSNKIKHIQTYCNDKLLMGINTE